MEEEDWWTRNLLFWLLVEVLEQMTGLLLSLDAHSHVDDYSGTLGGVRKVHISALVTSPKNWIVALSFSLCLSKTKQTKKLKN